MALEIREAKQFLADARKYRDNWLQVAVRSWDELKKRQPSTNRIWSVNSEAVRKRKAKYPAWWSIFKIRQSIVLAKAGVPVGKDTTFDGKDPIGAAAAVIAERLAINLAKSFDFLDVQFAVRDDSLATDFGMCRAFYERQTVQEYKKEYIFPQMDASGQTGTFVDAKGKEVLTDDINQDDQGFFINKKEVVDVEDERIYLEPVLYKDAYLDPGVRRFQQCKRIAFACHCSDEDFKRLFGVTAYLDHVNNDPARKDVDEAKKKDFNEIEYFEYWDFYERRCYYFTEYSTDFFKPIVYPELEDQDAELEQLNGIYNLPGFFPCPKPVIVNAPTDELLPVPEFYQIMELTENIHMVFSRVLLLTRAIRARLLYDKDITGLPEAINEATEADAIGVTNLANTLSKMGGDIRTAAQYLPVQECIDGLSNMWQQLENTLANLFRLTATSDLLQGLTQDNSGKTLGERQMEEKYALNVIEERQRKMAEHVRDSYQLLVDMAVRNFNERSLERYIVPATLPDSAQPYYSQAIQALRDHKDRFRVELETDSTIAINESYDKAMRIEIVNTMTAALERAANISQSNPELLVVELHSLKFLVQAFRQAKVFQTEIGQAIDQIVQKVQNAEPGFDKDKAASDLEQFKVQAQLKLDEYKVLSTERLEAARIANDQQRFALEQQLEGAKMAQADRLANINTQLRVVELSNKNAQDNTDVQLQYNKLAAEINVSREQLANDRARIEAEFVKIGDKKALDTFLAQLDANVKAQELALARAEQQLQAQKVMLDEREKYMTEARLQAEHQLNELMSKVEIVSKIQETQRPPEQPAPIVHVHPVLSSPTPQVGKKRLKVIRDDSGNISEIEHLNELSAE